MSPRRSVIFEHRAHDTQHVASIRSGCGREQSGHAVTIFLHGHGNVRSQRCADIAEQQFVFRKRHRASDVSDFAQWHLTRR